MTESRTATPPPQFSKEFTVTGRRSVLGFLDATGPHRESVRLAEEQRQSVKLSRLEFYVKGGADKSFNRFDLTDQYFQS
jgi:hypothetical protein